MANQINAEIIDKFLQIGKMQGNVNVNGIFNRVIIHIDEMTLAQIDAKKYRSQNNYTDIIIGLANKFHKDQLMDLDTCQEITILLFLHPNPEMPTSMLFAQRPLPDLITMLIWLPFVVWADNEGSSLKSIGIDSKKKYDEIIKAFYQKFQFNKIHTYDAAFVTKTANEFMHVIWENHRYAKEYSQLHPEVLNLEIDQYLAFFTAVVYPDDKALIHIKDTRQVLHNIRVQNSSTKNQF